MIRQFFKRINLQLFGDGAGAAGTAAGAGATGAATAGDATVSGADDRTQRLVAAQEEREQKRNPLRNVQYGRQTMQAEPAAQEQTEQTQRSIEDEWEELKKGRFKDLYGRDVKAGIDNRFKNQQDLTAKLESYNPLFEALAKKNGLDPKDHDAIIAKVLDDDSLYEEEAERMGMTVDAYKTFSAIKAKADAADAQREQDERQAQLDAHWRNLTAQAETLKQTYPGFDLQTELENPEFFRMTMPGSGVSLEAAYYAMHHRELQQNAMAYAAQKNMVQVSQAIQSNSRRPDEGALRQQAAVDVRPDPRSLTKADREEIKRRAERAKLYGGERISF